MQFNAENEPELVAILIRQYMTKQEALWPAVHKTIGKNFDHTPQFILAQVIQTLTEHPEQVDWRAFMYATENYLMDYADDEQITAYIESSVLETLARALDEKTLDGAVLAPFMGELSKKHMDSPEKFHGLQTQKRKLSTETTDEAAHVIILKLMEGQDPLKEEFEDVLGMSFAYPIATDIMGIFNVFKKNPTRTDWHKVIAALEGLLSEYQDQETVLGTISDWILDDDEYTFGDGSAFYQDINADFTVLSQKYLAAWTLASDGPPGSGMTHAEYEARYGKPAQGSLMKGWVIFLRVAQTILRLRKYL